MWVEAHRMLLGGWVGLHAWVKASSSISSNAEHAGSWVMHLGRLHEAAHGYAAWEVTAHGAMQGGAGACRRQSRC
jgi:hypothetical protein